MNALLASLTQPLPVDPTPVETPDVDWAAAAPLLVVVGGALVLLLVASFVQDAMVRSMDGTRRF